jgi:uncharacterized protein YunC (DUF1805 family)
MTATERLLAAVEGDLCMCGDGDCPTAEAVIEAFAAEQRAAGVREAADILAADAERLTDRDGRAAEVLGAAAYLLRARADHIAPPTPEEATP